MTILNWIAIDPNIFQPREDLSRRFLPAFIAVCNAPAGDTMYTVGSPLTFVVCTACKGDDVYVIETHYLANGDYQMVEWIQVFESLEQAQEECHCVANALSLPILLSKSGHVQMRGFNLIVSQKGVYGND